MADASEPDLPARPGVEAGEPERIVVGDEAAAEAAAEDLEERTAGLPDADVERAFWTWWRTEGAGELSRLLRSEWNPIGGDDVPQDEYAGYATRIGGLLREGVSEQELAAFLAEARTGSMGLPADREHDERVAAAIHAWYLTARRNAR